MEAVKNMESLNVLAKDVIGACISVHRALGIGLNKKVYAECLRYELQDRGIQVLNRVEVPVFFKNHIIDSGLTIDFLIDENVILLPIVDDSIKEHHVLELLNQLKHANLPLGLVVNFNAKHVKGDAIRRIINGYLE